MKVIIDVLITIMMSHVIKEAEIKRGCRRPSNETCTRIQTCRFYNGMTKQQRKETKDLAPDPSVLSSAAAGRMNAKGLSGGRGASRWRREPRDKGKGVGEGVLRGSGRLAWGGRRQGCDQEALSRCSAPSPEHEAVALEGGGRKSEEITGDNERVLCVYVCMCIRINMCVCVHRTRVKRKDTINEGRGMAQKKEGRSLRATIATFNF